jgi:hypothetical protein
MVIVPPNAILVNEFKVESLNLEKNSLTISLGYALDSNKAKLTKKFGFGENIVNFTLANIAEIKQAAAGRKIDKEEEMKEKLVNTLARVLHEVEGLKKIRDAGAYMRAYNKIQCYKISFPDIEY